MTTVHPTNAKDHRCCRELIAGGRCKATAALYCRPTLGRGYWACRMHGEDPAAHDRTWRSEGEWEAIERKAVAVEAAIGTGKCPHGYRLNSDDFANWCPECVAADPATAKRSADAVKESNDEQIADAIHHGPVWTIGRAADGVWFAAHRYGDGSSYLSWTDSIIDATRELANQTGAPLRYLVPPEVRHAALWMAGANDEGDALSAKAWSDRYDECKAILLAFFMGGNDDGERERPEGGRPQQPGG